MGARGDIAATLIDLCPAKEAFFMCWSMFLANGRYTISADIHHHFLTLAARSVCACSLINDAFSVADTI
jgi:hypothetical protein